MSGEDAPRPYLENLIVLEIKTNKQAWPQTLKASQGEGAATHVRAMQALNEGGTSQRRRQSVCGP
jgi:hypothetical protein